MSNLKKLIMEQVKISKETNTFAVKKGMGIVLCGEGVVYIFYSSGITNEGENTAKVIALLKKDNPSLMVTGLAPFVTSIYAMGIIVNFEVKL